MLFCGVRDRRRRRRRLVGPRSAAVLRSQLLSVRSLWLVGRQAQQRVGAGVGAIAGNFGTSPTGCVIIDRSTRHTLALLQQRVHTVSRDASVTENGSSFSVRLLSSSQALIIAVTGRRTAES